MLKLQSARCYSTIRLVWQAIIIVGASALPAAAQELPVRVDSFRQEVRRFYSTESGLPSNDVKEIFISNAGRIVATTSGGAASLQDDVWVPMTREAAEPSRTQQLGILRLPWTPTEDEEILSAVHWRDGQVVGTKQGLYSIQGDEVRSLFPTDARRRWAPSRVYVDRDAKGRIWFASQQGIGNWDGQTWTLFDGRDGVPYHDCTCLRVGAGDDVWIGTKIGVVRFDGETWYYRQGKRWLPHDEVRDIAIDDSGGAWVATAGGIAHLHFRSMTLAEKATHYESEIDTYHRRTAYGYVIEGHAEQPGQKKGLRLRDSDNDGLWTSMYGAGECFAYGATKDPVAKRRAKAAFDALRFLSLAPARPTDPDHPHAPPAGFIARTVLESSEPDPNLHYTLSQQKSQQAGDGYWRVYEPRWPRSADGKYYWKSDTSSDELDGHYFFYPLYYDLVADTDAEKKLVRELVRANMDHLIAHDFALHDHAGRTRWAVFTPSELNHNPEWFEERGLNSLSMLSYLNVAHHITGDDRYRRVAAQLRERHAFHTNVLYPKNQRGMGTGNQSDDEMAFMAFYNLIRYEPDESLRKLYTVSFANYWRLEEPEMNPFFNFCFAAVAFGEDYKNIWGTHDLSPWKSWLAESMETLKRFPLDRFNWRHTNHHRTDLQPLPRQATSVLQQGRTDRGYRRNGKVLPVDERYFNHWNHDPWALDTGGDGRTLGTGAVFTLPYYMGLYHGFIE